MMRRDNASQHLRLSEDERAILVALFDYVHLTTEHAWRLAGPEKSKRTIERALERLRSLRLIAGAPLAPELGAGSPLAYHLLLAGARAIGETHLGAQHYRQVGREAFRLRAARAELGALCRQTGWRLVWEEAAMRQELLAYLSALACAQYGEQFAPHTLASLLPDHLAPDAVLVTNREALPIILAHPQAGRPFWRGRLKKYAPIITRVRALGIVPSARQQVEAQAVLDRSAWRSRYLLLQPHELPSLLVRLA